MNANSNRPLLRTRRRRPAAVAFTLIELLVVIGIISILIGIAVPAITKGLQAANRIKCASNLKQVGVSISLYAEHSPRNPRMFFPPQPGKLWTDMDELVTNAADRAILLCPAGSRGPTNSTYSSHPRLMPEKPAAAERRTVSDVLRTSATLLMTDGMETTNSLNGAEPSLSASRYKDAADDANASKGDDMVEDANGPVAGPGTVSYRHKYDGMASATVLFIDGHAEPVKWNDLRKKNFSTQY